MHPHYLSPSLITAIALAVGLPTPSPAQVPIRQVAVPGAAAPGGGNYDGVNFRPPVGAASGEVFFEDGTAGIIVGQPGALARLNLTASTIAGLTLGSGETLFANGGISVLGNPAPGQYLVQAKISTAQIQNTALVIGTPGAFTKILRTGDPLPGTTATWAATRFSPTLYVQEDLPTTRNGSPMIKAITADDSQAYIGLYRNGTWEATQVVGITPPGFTAGNRFDIGAVNVRAGNSSGQFIFKAQIYNGPFPLSSGAYLGQNGSLRLIAKTGDVLAGDPRQLGAEFQPGSINDAGTVALAGTYGSGLDGYVYRWSAAGGASKVIAHGDPLPSAGSRAIYKGPSLFHQPLINASGAVLFFGIVQVDGITGNSLNERVALLYQAAPGTAVVKVAMAGEPISGMPVGNFIGFSNVDSINLNDAGQIAFTCLSSQNTSAASRSGGNSLILAGGTAPNVVVIAREDTPAAIDGLSGSRTFLGIMGPSFATNHVARVSGESGAFLSNQGEIVFRGTIPGSFFGQSTVFQARLNESQTSPLAAQNITFPQPFTRAASAGQLALNATASSGLPVSYALVSGPATVSGNTVNFTGSTGEVVVRASQLGNASFLAAELIDRTIRVTSDLSLLPPPGTAPIMPVMLPQTSGPGAVYSGMDRTEAVIFPDGIINFKDAATNDVITPGGIPTRLNFSAATLPGVTIPAGEVLDARDPIVLATSNSGPTLLTAFVRPPGISDTTNRVIATGTAENFTELLQTSDVLPGTTSVFGSTAIPFITEPPFATRGGAPWVFASAPNGLSSHIGIYRNSAWEPTQIHGVRPPGGYAVGTKFSDPQFLCANSAGDFLFTSAVVNASNTPVGGGLFHGKNGGLSLVTFNGGGLGGDTRVTLPVTSKSINASGEAAIYGSYRQVAGNQNQGGFVYRWTLAGGFTPVLKRGDFIPALGANIVFDTASRPPLINDAGALVMLAAIADRHPTTAVLSNFRPALLYQPTAGAPIQKVLMAGESVPGAPAGFGNLLNTNSTFGPISSIQLNNSGQIAIFVRAGTSSFGGYASVYGGTLPNINFILKAGPIDISGAGTRSMNIGGTSIYDGVDAVTGELGSRLSEAGDFAFRGEYSRVGNGGADSAVFKASVIGATPAPVPQVITFPPLADRLINSSAFNLVATSDAGLPITYQLISGPAALGGTLLTPGANAGLVTVRATQAGNTSFLAATPVDRSFRLVVNASELAMTQYLAAGNVPPADRLAHLDLDRDGLANLLEFALGGNPLLSDPQKLPGIRLENGVLTFTYTRAQVASVVYTVTTSADFTLPWSISGVTQGTPGVNGLTTATLSLASGPSAFLRLEVSLAP